MKISGIIAEYNPFHNGHACHLERTKAQNGGYTVCVMGGNFSQRGEPSLIRKQAKALAAVKSGADLVIELPLAYTLSAAKDFALGGVKILNALGCVDYLSFGAESGNQDLLESAAEKMSELEKNGMLANALSNGAGFAGAWAKTLSDNDFATEAEIISKPNNILAVEYLRALNETRSKIKPTVIKRVGANHDEINADGEIASASAIRRLITDGETEKAYSFMPQETVEIIKDEIKSGRAPVTVQSLETALLSRLRLMTPAAIQLVPGISEGLENRVMKSVISSGSFEEIVHGCVTKRYTAARIRRILMCCAVGITNSLSHSEPPYIKVLAAGKNGYEILKAAKAVSKVPIVSRAADILKLGDTAKQFFSCECAAADLYSLAFNPRGKMGTEMTENNF